MQVELKEIQRRLGVTTVFVTHDQGEALSMSDGSSLMSARADPAGRHAGSGLPAPAGSLRAGFIGDVNRLPGRLEARAGERATVAIRDLRREVEAAGLGTCAVGAAVDV